MKEKLTVRRLNSLEVTGKEYEVHDTTVPGLFVRVTAGGAKSFVVTWARGRKKTLGRVGVLTLAQAHEEALQYLSEARKHGEPLAVSQGRRGAAIPTLRQFLEDTYLPWFEQHHKSFQKTKHALEYSFATLMERRIDDIALRDLETLRVSWLAGGLSESSANRKMASLRGVFSRAVEWEYLASHPMVKLKQIKTDTKGRIRYLLPEEEKRLRAAMDARQEQIRTERDSANQWRKERNKELLPDLRKVEFADHLKPLVLVSLNTGMRQGEVFNLTWADVDLKNKVLTVEGEGAKSGQTRHIPMNREALATLKVWKKQSGSSEFVFPGKTGGRLDNVKKSWAGLLEQAGIKAFRWHDLRHTFASKLVMAGVPLNTVRELMGHADLKMTLRYAHLAPDSKAAAVELLG